MEYKNKNKNEMVTFLTLIKAEQKFIFLDRIKAERILEHILISLGVRKQ